MTGASEANFGQLLRVADRLTFHAHAIDSYVDRTGRYAEPLDREFPFMIRLFRLRAGAVARAPSWHERLELFLPLDGPCTQQMGDRTVTVPAGSLLVVDNLRLHRTCDLPELDTRTIVISFHPEFVYSLGSPAYDGAFLLPFYPDTGTEPHRLDLRARGASKACRALVRLIECYFDPLRTRYREAGCKAYLLLLLHEIVRSAGKANWQRTELKLQQSHSVRLRPLLEHIRDHYARRISMAQAATLCDLSKPQFTRVFKRVAGMTFVSFINHVRLSRAAQLLKETGLTIAEIAYATGFADQAYFDRQFRRSFGRSPREFRPREPFVQKKESDVLAASRSGN